jgi:hypothetical protein
MKLAASAVNHLPTTLQEQVCIWSGWMEATSPRKLATVSGEEVAKNLDLDLYHMQDPVQDRLMVKRMSYFRLKRRTLGPAYERFLRECLAPDGTIVIVECGLQWLTIRRGDRYTFQFGALGGATAEEMMHGGDRVEGLPSTSRFTQGALGAATGGRDEPRGREGLRAIAARRCAALRPAPRVPGPTRRVRAAGRHESDGGRPLSLVVSAAWRHGQSLGG